MQWDSLESYFLSRFEDNDEKTKDDDKVPQEIYLVRKFNDLFTKLYALFAQSIMPSFDAYYTFLQSEELLVHLLQDSTLNLYMALLPCFIKPDVIAQSDDILCTDIEDFKNYKKYSSIHIGFPTKQNALSKDLIGTSKYTKFLGKANNFILKPAVIY